MYAPRRALLRAEQAEHGDDDPVDDSSATTASVSTSIATTATLKLPPTPPHITLPTLTSLHTLLTLFSYPEFPPSLAPSPATPNAPPPLTTLLSIYTALHPLHIKLCLRAQKRLDAYTHTVNTSQKLQHKITKDTNTVKELESAVDYESVELKDSLKLSLEASKKAHRIATKRQEEVYDKYRQVAVTLDDSCSKVNAVLALVSVLVDHDVAAQESFTRAIGGQVRELIETGKSLCYVNTCMFVYVPPPHTCVPSAGGHRTLWAALHVLGSSCRTRSKNLRGLLPNSATQNTLCEDGTLTVVVATLTTLLVEDGKKGPSHRLGEYRHAIEVLYWMIKGNKSACGRVRELGGVEWLIDIAARELPFADYDLDEEEEEGGDEGDESGYCSSSESEQSEEEVILSYSSKYTLPPNHHQDPHMTVHQPPDSPYIELSYHYCSLCLIPASIKTSLRPSFKDSSNDGAIYAAHVLAVIFEEDNVAQEIARDYVVVMAGEGAMTLGSMINKEHVRELGEATKTFFWISPNSEEKKSEPNEEEEGSEVGEVGALIQNFFNDDDSTITNDTLDASLAESSIATPSVTSTIIQLDPAQAPLPSSFPAISMLTALLTTRLRNKCWGNAAAVAQCLSKLALPSPWPDRNPSKIAQPHAHLEVQETGTVSYEISQAIIASGCEDGLAYGLTLLTSAETRPNLVAATGPDGTPLLMWLLCLLGRLMLSHEDLRDDVGTVVLKDKAMAASIPGSRAGGSRSSKHSRQSTPMAGTPLPTKANLEGTFRVLIESMINGVRVFTGQGMDGMSLSHSSSEVNNCDLNIKIEACCAVASLCEGHGGGCQSFAEVGMPALRALVAHSNKSNPPELQVQACRCMYSTAVLKVVKQRLSIELKSLAMLLVLLHTDEPDVVIFACCAIQKICEDNHAGQQFIAQHKGLLPFVRICSGNWGGGVDGGGATTYFATANAAACKTVAAIATRHTQNRDLANNVKLVPHITSVLLKGDAEEKKSAVLAFSHLLQHNTVNRDVMVQVGGVEALAMICRLGDDFLKSIAALQMKIVCANSDRLTKELTHVGGVPPLINMMNSTDMLLRRHAAQTVSGLIMNKEFLKELLAGGGCASVVGLLVDEDDETATYACCSIGRIVAQDKKAHGAAFEMGALQILVQMAAGSREVGKVPEGVQYMDGGEHAGESRAFEAEGESDKLGFGHNISAARGSGLGDEMNKALRCTREAAIAAGNFATNEESYILDGSSNFAEGRRVSGMLPTGLLGQAPTTHQPSSDFSRAKGIAEESDESESDDEVVEEVDEVTGMTVRVKKHKEDDFVPEIAQRLARRTEADRLSVMSAYIARQEELRNQLRRKKKLEEESSEEEEESSSEEEVSEEEEESEFEEEEGGKGGEVFTF